MELLLKTLDYHVMGNCQPKSTELGSLHCEWDLLRPVLAVQNLPFHAFREAHLCRGPFSPQTFRVWAPFLFRLGAWRCGTCFPGSSPLLSDRALLSKQSLISNHQTWPHSSHTAASCHSSFLEHFLWQFFLWYGFTRFLPHFPSLHSTICLTCRILRTMTSTPGVLPFTFPHFLQWILNLVLDITPLKSHSTLCSSLASLYHHVKTLVLVR